MVLALDSISQSLRVALDALRQDSAAADLIRLTVLGHSTTVTTYLDLANVRENDTTPHFEARSRTNPKVLVRDLCFRISTDLILLQSETQNVLEPVAFFLTDGSTVNENEWAVDLQELKECCGSIRTVVVAIGDWTTAGVLRMSQFADVTIDAGGHRPTRFLELMMALVKGASSIATSPDLPVPLELGGDGLAVEIGSIWERPAG